MHIARKSKVKIQAIDGQGKPLANVTVNITQKKPDFPFGCAMNERILTNTDFQNWFTPRFKLTTFENEMKWYFTENSPGRENYTIPDAMLQFAKEHNISVRGHTVFWDDPRYNNDWVKSLPPNELSLVADRRMNSIMNRYSGHVVHWDVVNENLHFSFLESKLGENASAVYYLKAQQLDGKATLFLNEYNTIEEMGDEASTPTKYLEKIREIQSKGYQGSLGIGLEGHFRTPNLPYIRAAIDQLAIAGSPIWLTELDVESSPNQASFLMSNVTRFNLNLSFILG
ncbi:unnamed protein product [Ilex paraguariensis]|uniref:GH10 domain-containing protein n=1 Tax=Ilex paraguariensis TaxID=185542 RepID=A0ABC8UIJ5_9AQUA